MRRGGGGGGGGGFGNMQQIMQQAKQMQQKMEQIQAELATKTVEGAAGGGAVKAVVSGKQELVSLTIAPEALEGADAEMLSDMVKGAVNEALRKSQELQNSMMGGAMGGMSLPPGLF
jgi:DNA-binding YbaB/EbfC family protein